MIVTKDELLAAVARGVKAAVRAALGQPCPATPSQAPYALPPALLHAALAAQVPAAARVRPAARPAPPGKLYKVTATSISGPTASSKQQYLNVNLVAEDCTKAHLRFYWNSSTRNREWKILFAVLLRNLGLSDIIDTEQMRGRKVHLDMRGRPIVAGLDSVAEALGFQFSD